MTRMPETAKILPFPPNGAARGGSAHARPVAPPDDRAAAALREAVYAHIDAGGGGEGLFPLPAPEVHVIRAMRHVPANRQIYRPSLCVVVEGLKQIEFGDDSLEYGAMECLIVNMEMPASGRIVGASPGEPFVGMTIDFNLELLREVLEQLEQRPKPGKHDGPSIFVTRVTDSLADCLVRMLRLTKTPEAVPILFPSLMREVYYWLLTGPLGGEICKQLIADTHLERITRAIRLLRERFAEKLRIEDLADAAGMSPSSFHQHFKTLTLMTPIQFQKQLRLMEARRLMLDDAANVTTAAYQVGYESTSQFTREYSRTFGIAPKRDVLERKALIAAVTGR